MPTDKLTRTLRLSQIQTAQVALSTMAQLPGPYSPEGPPPPASADVIVKIGRILYQLEEPIAGLNLAMATLNERSYKRDDAGKPVPVLDGNGQPTGNWQTRNPLEYQRELAEITTKRVTVRLTRLTMDELATLPGARGRADLVAAVIPLLDDEDAADPTDAPDAAIAPAPSAAASETPG